MRRTESLEVSALRALAGEASISTDRASELLDLVGLRLDDVEEATRPLWALLIGRIRRREELDFPSIKEALSRSGHPNSLIATALDVIGDPDLGVAQERLTLLHQHGMRQRYVQRLTDAAKAAEQGEPLPVLQRMARDAADSLAHDLRVRNCAGDAIVMLDRLEALWTGKAERRLMTGFEALDEEIGGLPNNLIVIGARPGVGKSALVAGLIHNLLQQNVKPGLLSYEDDTLDMEARLAALEGGARLRAVRGDLLPNGGEKDAIASGLTWLSTKSHLLETDDARPVGTTDDVVASMRSMRRRGCRVAILDNLTCTRMDSAEERYDLVVERALSEIRSTAQELHMPAIIVGHLKRGISDAEESSKPPRLSDFRNASAWENYSRLALGMWKENGEPVLRILKATNGPPGADFDLTLHKDSAVIVGATKRVASADDAKRSSRYDRRAPEDRRAGE